MMRKSGLGLALQLALAACASSGWQMQPIESGDASTESYGYYYSSGPEAFFEKGSSLPVTRHTEVLSSGSIWQGEELGKGSQSRQMRVELGPSFNDSDWRLDLRSSVVRGEEVDEDHLWLAIGPRVQATYTGLEDLTMSTSVEYLNGIGTSSRVGSSINLDTNSAMSGVLRSSERCAKAPTWITANSFKRRPTLWARRSNMRSRPKTAFDPSLRSGPSIGAMARPKTIIASASAFTMSCLLAYRSMLSRHFPSTSWILNGTAADAASSGPYRSIC
jgi:hypothetical protein